SYPAADAPFVARVPPLPAPGAAHHRAPGAALAVGPGHPLARLLLAAAALAAAAVWEAGHRVTDLHPARRHHHERQARA
ncbi:hypothetical protein ACWDE9_37610, partial [Streptomyces olivaceoviridis]